jgi:glycine/D-amino acid oxidase-like deaminating enzyme
MSDIVDAIVIGAGVQGASLAFHLAEHGLRPVVLERATIASGATGRSSGLVRMHYDVEADARLAHLSYGYFRDWNERVGGDAGFVRTGFLQLVPEPEVDALRQNVAMQRRLGIHTELVDAVEVGRLVPGIATHDVTFAAWEADSGYADPTATATSLMTAATARGARLVQAAPVTALLVNGSRIAGVETARGTFMSEIVVDAAGAWAGRLAAMVGLDLPIEVWRHDVAYVRRPSGGPSHPALIDFANAFYARPEGAQLTLIGLEDGNEIGGSPDRATDAAAPGFVERAAERICRRLPELGGAGLQSAHSGQDGITPDQHPIIGPAGPDGFYLDCGFSGTGFKTAPAVGAALAELILEGEARSADLHPYRPSRFAESDPVVGAHPYAPIWRTD